MVGVKCKLGDIDCQDPHPVGQTHGCDTPSQFVHSGFAPICEGEDQVWTINCDDKTGNTGTCADINDSTRYICDRRNELAGVSNHVRNRHTPEGAKALGGFKNLF
jgi:hypothetical protein